VAGANDFSSYDEYLGHTQKLATRYDLIYYLLS
jgi:hypothetical protein